MAKLVSPAGDLRAMRERAESKFYSRKIKDAGSCGEPSLPMVKKEQEDFQGITAGTPPKSK